MLWTLVLEKTLESPLDCKDIKPVHPKGDQSWVFIGRTGVEAETPILWPPDAKSWFIERPWCWERLKTGGEGGDRGWDGWMASPTRRHEFEQALVVGDRQGSLACCSPWGRKESDMTEWPKNNMVQEVVTKTIPRKINTRMQNGCLRRPYKQQRKEWSKRQRKGKIYPNECRVPENSKER